MTTVMLMAGMLIAVGWLAILGIAVGLCWAAKRGDRTLLDPEPAFDLMAAHDMHLVVGEAVGSAGSSSPLR